MRKQLLICASIGGLACGGPVEPVAGDVERQIAVDGLTRRFLAHIPAETPPGGFPVILVLHGSGQTAEGIRSLSGFDGLADEMGFVAVYPAGAPDWEVAEGAGLPDDVKFLRKTVDMVADMTSVDRDRVSATGLSRGGFMSHYLACRMSDELAAVAPVAGGLLSDVATFCDKRDEIGVLGVHGTSDPIVPFEGEVTPSPYVSFRDAMLFWARENSCDEDPREVGDPDGGGRVTLVMYTGCQDNVRVEGIVLNGAGHIWPITIWPGSRRIAEFLLAHTR